MIRTKLICVLDKERFQRELNDELRYLIKTKEYKINSIQYQYSSDLFTALIVYEVDND